ncbi:ABC transporter ATP-binding/permease protein [Candidatus Cyrtobacter comes]|uniref:ABC transporter ATP-binding/permease protein n=1 Tax=Candidatus Cyrtobacter comes TaxID=675776 RepID=A0ABU5L884_9RICK|nr:ABC transporter ATP-binding protein [Candidatus Cyrtobacter comes]MDZ5762085.1 ABC transporter ATP-binding/permease protein [Candidatus Cyrtobacter comes]
MGKKRVTVISDDLPKNVFRFLLKFVNIHSIGFLMIAISAIFADISMAVLLPYAEGNLVDSIGFLADNKDLSAMLFPVLYFILIWLLIELSSRFKGVLLAIFIPRLEGNMRVATFNQVNMQSHSYFVQSHVGGIAQRISDMPRSARLLVDDTLTVFLPLILSIIITSSLFFHIHPLVSLVFVIWFSVHIIVCVIFCARAADRSSIQSAARANVQSKIIDSITNHLMVKLFSGHKHEMNKVLSAQEEEIEKYKSALLYTEKIKIALSSVSILSSGILICLSFYLWSQGEISVGKIIFLIGALSSLTDKLWMAGDEMSYFVYEYGVLAQSLNLVRDPSKLAEEEDKIDLKITKGDIEFKDVSFSYSENRKILKKKSLFIHGGTKVGLVGLSGSGKTTFANLLMRLYEVDEGTINIDGKDISLCSIDSIRENISFIPQSPFLFHTSVMENIRYGKLTASDEEVITVSKKAMCHEFILNLPDGYSTLVGERGDSLSGGQRQRVAIARAMLKNAPIIVMDEATSALDSVVEKIIENNIKSLMDGKTVIVIAHRLSTLFSMDNILVFRDGIIVEQGTHKHLLAINGYYKQMWDAQKDGMMPEIL